MNFRSKVQSPRSPSLSQDYVNKYTPFRLCFRIKWNIRTDRNHDHTTSATYVLETARTETTTTRFGDNIDRHVTSSSSISAMTSIFLNEFLLDFYVYHTIPPTRKLIDTRFSPERFMIMCVAS